MIIDFGKVLFNLIIFVCEIIGLLSYFYLVYIIFCYLKYSQEKFTCLLLIYLTIEKYKNYLPLKKGHLGFFSVLDTVCFINPFPGNVLMGFMADVIVVVWFV